MDKLTRTAYRDPATSAERDGSAARRETLLDHEQYLGPLERAHGSALHAPGVATGLEIRATENAAGLRVLPGVAISPAGDHIVLTADGQARVADALVPVTGDGAQVPTAGLTGEYLLTIAWAETFDRATFDRSQGKKFQIDHTPRLALHPATDSLDTDHIVLATLTLNDGAVSNADGRRRRHTTEQLTVHRVDTATRGPELTVQSAVAAQLQARSDGVELSLGVDGLLTSGELAVRSAYANDAQVNNLVVRDALSVTGNVVVDGLVDFSGYLKVTGQSQLQGQVYVGTNPTGLILRLNDDLWFRDPQNGSIQIRSGDDSTWGTMVGHFVAPSSAAVKEGIELLDFDRLQQLHDDVVSTPVASFSYRGAGEQARRSLGVILERCPPYLADGIGLNPIEYAAMLHAAVTVLSRRVTELTAQLAELTREGGSR